MGTGISPQFEKIMLEDQINFSKANERHGNVVFGGKKMKLLSRKDSLEHDPIIFPSKDVVN